MSSGIQRRTKGIRRLGVKLSVECRLLSRAVMGKMEAVINGPVINCQSRANCHCARLPTQILSSFGKLGKQKVTKRRSFLCERRGSAKFAS